MIGLRHSEAKHGKTHQLRFDAFFVLERPNPHDETTSDLSICGVCTRGLRGSSVPVLHGRSMSLEKVILTVEKVMLTS